MTYQLHHGNCIDIMPLIERESIDAVICDPPYGLTSDGKTHELGHPSWNASTQSSRRGGFMGKDWDHGVPGMHFWLEALRCAKPGAYLLAFGGTRTFHRLAVAIEDAGWEIRDTVMWVYGSGFPKSHDVSKAIDREAGAEKEVIGKRKSPYTPTGRNTNVYGEYETPTDEDGYLQYSITSPATPAAAEWDGWGTALKPAWEPIIVARKPLQGTVAENVQRYGTGAMNIDGCRIETEESMHGSTRGKMSGAVGSGFGFIADNTPIEYHSQGRWPANLIHDGSAEVLAGFPMTTQNGYRANPSTNKSTWFGATDGSHVEGERGFNDTGSAARFFYCAKASKQDRDEGLEGFEEVEMPSTYGDIGPMDGNPRKVDTGHIQRIRNPHPTVKPTALMRYLCRLVTPPQGVILDPFMGSGSTGKAAMLEGFNFIGIDTELEYVEIAARRIEHACEKVGIVIEQPMMFETKRETVDRPKQLILL